MIGGHFLLFALATVARSVEIDPNGYVIYCPCMGRFGNQVDQLLGSVAFAKGLDRTLVLPPFIDFSKPGQAAMIPFEEVYQPKTLGRHLKVITMGDFKRNIAPEIWPKEKRQALCWSPRESFYQKGSPPGVSQRRATHLGLSGIMLEWSLYLMLIMEILRYTNFSISDIFHQGGYDLTVSGSRKAWSSNYPSAEYPVLAFTGAPAAFPSRRKDWETQKYLRWNTKILQKARSFINQTLTRPFVGIHLRNNVDWNSVCDHINSDRTEQLFASAQCLNDAPRKGDFTRELCSPSEKTVIDAVVDQVGKIGAKSVYVTSDKDFMVLPLGEALAAYDIKVYTLKEENPHVALAILQESDHFIGNCISTFTSIVTRHRQFSYAQPRPTTFFGHMPKHDEYAPKKKIEL
ncbi:unnamed protein product, partial [Mesorhabditis spiculigera]